MDFNKAINQLMVIYTYNWVSNMLEINLYSSKFRPLNKPDHILDIKEIQLFFQSKKHVGHFPEHYEEKLEICTKE